jgi:hypothetical protein
VGEYRPAAICKRGHVITEDASTGIHVTERCEDCGAKVLTACASCDSMIRGDYFVPGFIGAGVAYKRPEFCPSCGVPYPWASRQSRIYELGNLLEEEDLDPAAELQVREQLAALEDPDLGEVEQVTRWERIRAAAPAFWQKSGAQQIITTLVLAEGKKQLGLPPS